MFSFSSIPETFINDVINIDETSNIYPWKSNNLRDSFYQFNHLGMFSESQLIAYIFFQQTEFEAEIIHFVCAKDYQRQGFARQLVKEWIRCQLSHKHDKQLFLEVRADNERAKKLYSNAGFVEVGRRKGYYSNSEDAVLMSYNNS